MTDCALRWVFSTSASDASESFCHTQPQNTTTPIPLDLTTAMKATFFTLVVIIFLIGIAAPSTAWSQVARNDSTIAQPRRPQMTDVKPLDREALSLIKGLRGVQYRWDGKGRSHIGLLASEVAAAMPQEVAVTSEQRGTAPQAVNYSQLVVLLIEAVKEQQAQIEALQEEHGITNGSR